MPNTNILFVMVLIISFFATLFAGGAGSDTGEWKSMIRELLFPGLPESSLEAAPEKSESVSNERVLSFTGLDGRAMAGS